MSAAQELADFVPKFQIEIAHEPLNSYPGSNIRLAETWENSCQYAWQILAKTDLDNLQQVLRSRRRVNAALDGDVLVSNPGFRTIPLSQRADDISYELASFLGLRVDADTVLENLQTITQLEAAFYPVAIRKALLLPTDFKQEVADSATLADFAAFELEKAVWNNWQPPITTTPEAVLSRLEKFIAASLSYLDHRARIVLFRHGSIRVANNKPDFLDDPEERQHQRKIEFDSSTGNHFFHSIVETWHRRVTHLHMWDVDYLVSQLEPHLKLAAMSFFGYFGKNSPLSFPRKKIESHTLTRYRIHAFKRMLSVLNEAPLPESPFCYHLQESASEARTLSLGQRLIHLDSPRLKLLARQDHLEFTDQLTNTEKRVLTLATATEQDKFVYPNAAIARLTGYTAKSLETVLTRLANLAESQSNQRYIDQEGELITSQNQATLIQMRQDEQFSPERLAALSPQQRNIWELVTTPDGQNRYLSWNQVVELLSMRPNLKRIVEALQSCPWLATLKKQLAQANAELERYSPQHQQLIDYLLVAIQRGIPLRSAKASTPAWSQTCKGLGLSPRQGSKLQEYFSDRYPQAVPSPDIHNPSLRGNGTSLN
ncbi:hypothetical protein ACFLZP_04455 [Patescibacteria group bacterium]